MQRIIKFRGITTNEYIDKKFMHGYLIDMEHIKTKEYGVVKTIPGTVGQFTGLHDKNGFEIYEGDEVRVWGGEYCQGFWEHDSTIVIKDIRNTWFLGEYEFIEVIGNIYENPELLKGEE